MGCTPSKYELDNTRLVLLGHLPFARLECEKSSRLLEKPELVDPIRLNTFMGPRQ